MQENAEKKTCDLPYDVFKVNNISISADLAINTLMVVLLRMLKQQKIPYEEVKRLFDGLKNMYKEATD